MRRYSLRWVFANRVGGGSVPAPRQTPKPPSQFPLEPQPPADGFSNYDPSRGIGDRYFRTDVPGPFTQGPNLRPAPPEGPGFGQPIAPPTQLIDPGSVMSLPFPTDNQMLKPGWTLGQPLQRKYSLGDMNPVISPSSPGTPIQGGWNAAATPGQWHAGAGGWNAAATPGQWKAWQRPKPPQPPRVPTRGDMIFNALFDYLGQPHQ